MSDISKKRVFISYGRGDDRLIDDGDANWYDDITKSFSHKLYKHLDTVFDVWWDRKSLPSRALEFNAEIQRAVEGVDVVVLVVGEAGLKSDYVAAEWKYALELCKPVVPILLNGDFPSIPKELGVHAPDFRPARSFDSALAELINKLKDDPAPLGELYNVPSLPEWYVRRSDALDKLRNDVIADSKKPIVPSASVVKPFVVSGIGGIGKSTFAASLCHECDIRRAFPEGIFWVELGKEPQITSRQKQIGEIFGDTVDDYPDVQRGKNRLSKLLAGKRALIVLDDVWEHDDAQGFLFSSATVRWLITTRKPRLSSLLSGVRHELNVLTPDEGVELLNRRLKSGSPTAVLQEDTARAISEILDGHALALYIAGTRLLQVSEERDDFGEWLLNRLQSQPDNPFPDLQLDEDDKNLNVARSLAESYSDLDETHKRLFRLLGVFAADSSFDARAIEAVWAIRKIEHIDGKRIVRQDTKRATEDGISLLVQTGLLVSEGNQRYSQHNLLRAYAHALAESQYEIDRAQGRHFEHYMTRFGKFEVSRGAQLYKSIKPEFANVVIALRWGFTNNVEKACDVGVEINQYYVVHAESIETAISMLLNAYAAVKQSQYQQGEANILLALGSLRQRQEALEEAEELYQQALKLYRADGSLLGKANTLSGMGDLRQRQDALKEAEELHQEALELFRAIGDQLGEANTLHAIGDLKQSQDSLEEAEDLFQAALELYRMAGARLGESNILHAMGDLRQRQNSLEEADEFYSQALEMSRARGNRLGETNVYISLGRLEIRRKNYMQSQLALNAALEISQLTQDRLGQANSLGWLGRLALEQNDLSRVFDFLDQGLKLAESIKVNSSAAVIRSWIARATYQDGRRSEGIELMHQAIDEIEKLGLKWWAKEPKQWLEEMTSE
jgi:tetratricopeptide (TPR) repeat protein